MALVVIVLRLADRFRGKLITTSNYACQRARLSYQLSLLQNWNECHRKLEQLYKNRNECSSKEPKL